MPTLLRAWPAIHAATGARLRLIGTDPLQYRLLHARLRFDESGIDVLGIVTNEVRTHELLRAKASITPALGGESFGLVLAEAFACATPAVASDIPGYAAVATPEAAMLVPPSDPDALSGRGDRPALGREASRRDGPRGARACARQLRVGRHRAAARRGLRGGRRVKSRWLMVSAFVLFFGVAIALVVWHGPDWTAVHDAFTAVSWPWVAVAIGLNLLSVVARSISWDTCIEQSIEPPHPKYPLVFSAFCVGLFANAVLPGRVGEIARAAVLRRRMPGRQGHDRDADRIGVRAPHVRSLPDGDARRLGAARGRDPAVGVPDDRARDRDRRAAVRRPRSCSRGASTASSRASARLRLLLARARQGLAIMRKPVPALKATAFQYAGWFCQLLAVWAAMKAFQIDEPLAAAGLVLVLMNVATIVPLWPGNVGLVQVAVATPLVNYGIAYAHGIAFGIGLQAIEASVGIGIGLVFLAREGLSFATLRDMEDRDEDTLEDVTPVDHEPARSRVAG